MKYIEIDNKSALNKLKGNRRLPFHWDLNLYRGCAHGCKYCYALYSHSYLEDSNFFGSIYYKKNIVACLEKELSAKSWKREVINIGGVTDSYQPIEKQRQMMRHVLKLMIQYKNPIIISTKSDLILRDIDLIAELSRLTYVNIAFTITTTKEALREKLEPGGVSTERRFQALQQLKEHTNASLGIHVMPIIPYLTDSTTNLDTIFHRAAHIGVDYVLPGTLYLRGKTRPYFMDFLRRYDRDVYEKLCMLYTKGGANKAYKEELYGRINQLRAKYHVSSNYMKIMKEKLQEKDG